MKLKPNYKKLALRIPGFTPYTLPIGKLADYLKEMAAMIGTRTDAHFMLVDDGSADLQSAVRKPEYQTAKARIIGAQRGDGPEEAVRGYRNLRAMLRADQKDGADPAAFRDDLGRKIIEFPDREEGLAFGPVTEPGTIEGTLIKLGGRDETVPVHIQDETKYYKGNTTREIAKLLAPYLFAGSIRLHGIGKWVRTEDGEWILDSFRINSFDPLDDDAITAVLSRMREAESDWDKIADPLAELKRIRKGSSKVQ